MKKDVKKKSLIVKARELIRLVIIQLKHLIYVKIYRMNISKSARISFRANLDKTYPQGIFIGDQSYVSSGAMLLTHDYINNNKNITTVGKNCFIGFNAIIMPGITIGDSVIVGAGAVVTKDVQSGCIVAGNPAKVLKKNITTGKYGVIKNGKI